MSLSRQMSSRISARNLLKWERTPEEVPPSSETIETGIRWVKQLWQAQNTWWKEPSVTASESGEVVLEWRQGDLRLTLYVLNRQADAILSRGSALSEMESKECYQPSDVQALLQELAEA